MGKATPGKAVHIVFDRLGEGFAAVQMDMGQAGRSRRVLVLIGAIIILSTVDLLITLFHLQSIGMAEGNPLAAYLIRTTGSAWALAVFKGFTVVVCATLLYSTRRDIRGEIASWMAVVILVGVLVMWHFYTQATDNPEVVRIAQILHGENWLILD